MAEQLNEAPLVGSESGERTVVVEAGTSVQLQSQGVTGAWVDVPDGAFTGPTIASFRCPVGMKFRFSGGNVMVSG